MWWRDDAACASRPELFFGPDGEYRFAHEKRERAAKAVCALCPVRAQCLEYALAVERGLSVDAIFGVYGGVGEADRRVMRAGGVVTGLRLLPVVERLASGVKHCCRCDEDKPLSAYGKATRRADGLTAWCQDCTNEYARERHAALRAAQATGPEVALMNTLNWRDRAACRSVSPALFFSPDDYERPAAREMRERSARMVCASCPVTGLDGPCAQWANTTGDTFSISGGMTYEERLAAQYSGAGRQQSSNTARAQKARQRRAAIIAAGEKRCTGPCGQVKSLDDFTSSNDWLRGDCKDCRNARYRRQRREAAQQGNERELA